MDGNLSGYEPKVYVSNRWHVHQQIHHKACEFTPTGITWAMRSHARLDMDTYSINEAGKTVYTRICMGRSSQSPSCRHDEMLRTMVVVR